MCLVLNERGENALDNKFSILRGNEDILLIKRVSFLLGRTVFGRMFELNMLVEAKCSWLPSYHLKYYHQSTTLSLIHNV